MLVLNWPLAQRSGAELKIDGRTHAVTQHDPLEIAVEPGPHVVQITLAGSAPIVRSATIAPDGRALVAIAPPPPSATKLVFDWPADQRKNAELIIDGSKQTVPTGADSASFALVVAPGRRVVQITRTGFEPFKEEINLAAGANETVKPSWTPVQTVATTAPETTTAEAQPPLEAPAEQPAKKLPIPPAAEQEKVAKQLADLYKSSHSGSKDPAKAQELYDLAAKASAAERYVLLVKGAELAAAAGDVNLSLQGVGSLDAEFEIDALEAKQKLLDKFVSAGKAEQVDAAIPIAEQLMDQAVGADRFALAIEFAMIASRAATKSKIPTRKEIDERLSTRRHDIHVLEPLFAAAKTAQETLAKNPADAEANSNLGRWLCFYKGDWSAGLPLLAKGSDEKLKSLAEQELKAPTDAEQQAHIADVWWDVASKESGTARDSIHLHAGEIYEAASPNLTSTLRKAAIEKRLAGIAELNSAAAAATAISRGAAGRISGTCRITSKYRGLCLGTVGEGKQSGNAIGVWARAVGDDLIWEIVPIADGRFKIVNKKSGKCMGIENGRTEPGAFGLEWDFKNVPDQRWSVDPVGRGAYKFINEKSGLCLGVRADGPTVELQQYAGVDAQRWSLTPNAPNVRDPRGGSPAVSPIRQTSPALASGKVGTTKFLLNQWVDVLQLVDPAENSAKGTWSRRGPEIIGEAQGIGRLMMPVAVEGSYEMEVEFTRETGNSDVNTVVVAGSRQCAVMFSADEGEKVVSIASTGEIAKIQRIQRESHLGRFRTATATGSRSKSKTRDLLASAST